MLKVSLIERSLYNIIYESNPRNDNFGDLRFDGDRSLITRRKIYHINNDIIFGLNNGSIVYV